MQQNLENLDPESRAILERAMSSNSGAMAMGLDPVRQREQQQLAEDMERKNAEARRRRGAAIMGENPGSVPVASRQAPIKRRRKGMVEQRTPISEPDNGQPSGILPAAQMPNEHVDMGSGVDAGLLRKAFAKVSGNAGSVQEKDDRIEASPITEAHDDMPTTEPVRTAVPEQVSPDRPFDVTGDNPDFNVFTRIGHLPSKGLFYPRELLGQSLKLIDNYFLDDIVDGSANTRTALNAILARRICGINPLDILTCDEAYILHWLRASSFPKHGMSHPGYKCPRCGFSTATDALLKDFRIGFRNLKFTLSKDIDSIYALHREHGYHAGFLPDGRECHVYLHRLRHATILGEFLESWEAANGMSAPNAIRKIGGVATVVEIEGCEGMEEKVDYISNIPDSMKEQFEKLVVEGTVSCKVSAEIKCGRCGGMVETPYPFRLQWFVSGL